jgi:hypothetical protein
VHAIPDAAGTTLFNRAFRRPSSLSVALVFYAVGGARLGPGARGAPPRASTFSRTSIVSAKSGGTTQVVLNREGGADARGSARTMRWCDTCRRCAVANGFAVNATGSGCLTATYRSTTHAWAPLVMHRAYSPKRTAASESRKGVELRRAMNVPAGSCTIKTLAALRTLAAGESFADREEMKKRKPRHKRSAALLHRIRARWFQ